MKWMIAASITTLLLCSGSTVHAQEAAAPPAAAPAASAAPLDPRLDVANMAPNQREYLMTAVMSEQPAITPDLMKKFKSMYEKATPEMQLQMVTQVAQQLQGLPIIKEKVLKDMPAPIDTPPAAAPAAPATQPAQ